MPGGFKKQSKHYKHPNRKSTYAYKRAKDAMESTTDEDSDYASSSQKSTRWMYKKKEREQAKCSYCLKIKDKNTKDKRILDPVDYSALKKNTLNSIVLPVN